MKFVISGFYGLGNTGDEAILEAIVDNLRDTFDHPDITVFSLSPKETAQTHGVKTVYRAWRRENKEKVKALREADVLISGGGGLLQDTYPTKFLFGPLPYYLLIVLLAKICGTKVMFFSQGIGPVNSRWGKFLMWLLANRADLITVRDQHSKDLLHKLRVRKPETVVTADIVFAFQPKPDDACMKSLPLDGHEKKVAVSIRPWFQEQRHYIELAKALDTLIETEQITPIFVPMEGHHDVKASRFVLDRMKHSDRCHLLGPDFTPNQYYQAIASCEMTIGLRLHSLIFSTLAGVPHVGISYDRKVESLLKRSGMWPFSSTIEEVSATKVVENVQQILHDRETYSHQVQTAAEGMRTEAKKNLELLQNYFAPTIKK
ncbi:polysaccharide pyruvyl transferase CsaB [Bacillus fonticola]|uniref:polysaccharide pyruvyl transferase CsaB n=1 Tax=Bacillus fonticola TaxID=2728853 RepID=UPI0014754750|nr:polysaccharide pyruvyl transferase CsaB [Bacillus fonticola]